jgi:hypothetical protein
LEEMKRSFMDPNHSIGIAKHRVVRNKTAGQDGSRPR